MNQIDKYSIRPKNTHEFTGNTDRDELINKSSDNFEAFKERTGYRVTTPSGNSNGYAKNWKYAGISHEPIEGSDKTLIFDNGELIGTAESSRTFSTGSRRDSNDNKPRISDMKAYTRKRFGYHMLIGSKNYGVGNFEKGQPTDSTLESIHRHLADYELGDRNEDHLSAVIFGIQLIMLNEERENVPTDFYYQKWVAKQANS